ncbi:hypothetical protein SH1V18_44390 [Vallitalea longa]|uniref:N-acetyltransferase domain-containing protein n=1 Tax=Vallitalea longa TaxID=2936439 RepID=A0A9W5YHD7_9FIRM|nr:GNAT family N-acetyltransferase [Vallitalea longa]GKX31959.1 hypothetical protein SH1V18_44390 [Vallitalea longa]
MIVVHDSKHEIIAKDNSGNILGEGYINSFLASDIFNKDRVNFFIQVTSDTEDKDFLIRKYIINELIKIAHNSRKNYWEYNCRVYNCCFPNDSENIRLYSSIKGFKHDEGMYVLSCDLKNMNINKLSNIPFEIKENDFISQLDTLDFIREHNKIFRDAPYSINEIDYLKRQEGFRSITIYDKGNVIANILLLVKKDNKKYGWVEDLFVNQKYRNKGLGEYLILRGLSYFKSIYIDESRLEVWSSNKRGMNLYYKLGYEFLEETQISIGMMI